MDLAAETAVQAVIPVFAVEDGLVQEFQFLLDEEPEKIPSHGNPRYDELRESDRDRLRQAIESALGLENKKSRQAIRSADPLAGSMGKGRRGRSCFVSIPGIPANRIGEADSLVIYCGEDSMATQFSSAAVEAGQIGIPVLFDDLGKEYLRNNKGKSVLPRTRQGCPFLIEDKD